MIINLHKSAYEKYNPNSTLMPESDTHTIGGYLKAQAWTFKDRNVCREFGDIIVKLQTGNKEERKEAYIRFFQFRRFFMSSEFKEYIDSLNTYRIKSNFVTIEELLEKVYLEITYPYSNLSEREAIMAKSKNKNKASSENIPVRDMACSIPEGTDPKAKRLLEALSEVVQAATEYIVGNSTIVPKSDIPIIEKGDDAGPFDKGIETSSTDNNLFSDPVTTERKPDSEDIFSENSSPDEKKPEASISIPATKETPTKETPREDMTEVIADCRKLLVSLAKKTMDIKAVDKFFAQFSQIVGISITQVSDIKDIETLNLCKQFLEKQIQ